MLKESTSEAVGKVERLRELMSLPGWADIVALAVEEVRQARTSLLTSIDIADDQRCFMVGQNLGIYGFLKSLYQEANVAFPDSHKIYFTGST